MGVVHIFESLSLARFVSSFDVPMTGQQEAIEINTICLAPPAVTLLGGLEADQEYELVGHYPANDRNPEHDVVRIVLTTKDSFIDRFQTSLLGDSLRVKGFVIQSICSYGPDGSALYSLVRKFGPADPQRAYLDAILARKSDCEAFLAEVVFLQVSVIARQLASFWKRYD